MAKIWPGNLAIFVQNMVIDDCAKDGGEEFFTEMHCVRITNL